MSLRLQNDSERGKTKAAGKSSSFLLLRFERYALRTFIRARSVRRSRASARARRRFHDKAKLFEKNYSEMTKI